MDAHPTICLIIWLLCLVLNGITGSAYAAFEGANVSDIKKKADDGNRRAKKALAITLRHKRFITVMDIAEFFYMGTAAVMFYAGPFKKTYQKLATDIENRFLLIVLCVVIVTALVYFTELFAYKLPRKLAFHYAETRVLVYSGYVNMLMVLFTPLAAFCEGTAGIILSRLNVYNADAGDQVTEEEIMSIVNEGHELGVLESDEAEMISNIFELNDLEVKDVMTHRKNIIGIDITTGVEEAFNFMLGEKYSRYPVYNETIDDIVGILHIKDVAAQYLKAKEANKDTSKLTIRKIARQPYFVPDTQNLDVLFHDMQLKKMHMAIAIDEYGQTAGLVAMEDILEEIVGDIQDEYDEEELKYREEADGSYIVQGSMLLSDLEDETDIHIGETEFDTVNGLLISELDHIPQDDETAVINYAGYRFEILETKNKMISLVKIRKLDESELEALENEGEQPEQSEE